MKQYILFLLMILLLGVLCKGQNPVRYDIVSSTNWKTTMLVDTTTGFAVIGSHTYTTRAAWLALESNTDEVDYLTITVNNKKAYLVRQQLDKYGGFWVVDNTKTQYASLVEVWYRRMRK